MRDTKQPIDLSALETDYDVVGELGATGSGRAYFGTRKDAAAKRRDDNTGVQIEVFPVPEGDEGNALSHLASDAKTLSGLTHRRLIPVIESRWVGKEVLAVVTQRTTDPTLAQLLRNGETFSNPRTAAILREVNGLLEWAREHNIVHRDVTPDRIYLEPRTDRVRVSFAPVAIPRVQRVEAADADALTIARLAMAMLVGKTDPADYEGKSLAELRPDLPDQLGTETATLLEGNSTDVDVHAYLALVGMADPVAAGETEAERIRQAGLEEQRLEREKIAGERAAMERDLEEQRAKFAAEAEEIRQSLAREGEALRKKFEDEEEELRRKFVAEEEVQRKKHEEAEAALRAHYEAEEAELRKHYDAENEELKRTGAAARAALAAEMEDLRTRTTKAERTVEEMRERLAKERAELRAAAEKERADMVAKRAELERGVAARLAELDRVATQDRERLEALRAELQRRGELELEKRRETALDELADDASTLDDESLVAPLLAMPVIAPLDEPEFDDTPLLHDVVDEAPPVEEKVPAPVVPDSRPVVPRPLSKPPIGAPAAMVPPVTPAPVVAPPVVKLPERAPVPVTSTTTGASRPRWLVPAGIAAVLVIGGGAAGLMSTRGHSAAPAPAARTVATSAPAVRTAPVAVTPPRNDAAWAAAIADSAAARQWLDSLKREHPADVSWAADIARAHMDREARGRLAAARAAATTAGADISTPPGTRAESGRNSNRTTQTSAGEVRPVDPKIPAAQLNEVRATPDTAPRRAVPDSTTTTPPPM